MAAIQTPARPERDAAERIGEVVPAEIDGGQDRQEQEQPQRVADPPVEPEQVRDHAHRTR